MSGFASLEATMRSGSASEARRIPQTVVRERLIRRLAQARDANVALLVAPAGYGKTTLLAQWAEHDSRPFAFVSARHTDGAQLLETVADMPAPFVVVLDEAEALPAAAMPALAALADRLPAGSQLAIASRSQPKLPLGRL